MNKKIIAGILIFTAVFTAIIFLWPKKAAVEDMEEELPTPQAVLPTVTENIKVSLSPKQDNRVMVLSISGMEGVDSVEYELTYNTGDGLPRGVLGKISVAGESEVERDDIVLGTCSSGKCVYDTGVTAVDLSLKFNSENGSSIFRKNYELN